MSKTTRLYQDTRSVGGGSGLDKLNDELQDVTRIMTKNMEELLWRGDSLDSACLLIACGKTSRADDLVFRDVPLIDIAPVGIREIPQGGTKHQHPGHAPPIRASRSSCLHRHYPTLLAILIDIAPAFYLFTGIRASDRVRVLYTPDKLHNIRFPEFIDALSTRCHPFASRPTYMYTLVVFCRTIAVTTVMVWYATPSCVS